jgi:hypothetical protein
VSPSVGVSAGKSSWTSRMGSMVVDVVEHFEQETRDRRDPAKVWSVHWFRSGGLRNTKHSRAMQLQLDIWPLAWAWI